MSGKFKTINCARFLIVLTFFRANDIDKATAAKFKVEQKQREEAKVRKDENSAFANKVRFNHEKLSVVSLA